jgi:hypothetical protein
MDKIFAPYRHCVLDGSGKTITITATCLDVMGPGSFVPEPIFRIRRTFLLQTRCFQSIVDSQQLWRIIVENNFLRTT